MFEQSKPSQEEEKEERTQGLGVPSNPQIQGVQINHQNIGGRPYEETVNES